MITIKIIIPELSDILRIINHQKDILKFIFSFPKYKIGEKFILWDKKIKIKKTIRNWHYMSWFYVCTDNHAYSEKLVLFYKERQK